jgi:hypothetical protein
MDNAHYIYMNKYDVGHFASMIGVESDKVRVVYNVKDPSVLFNWLPETSLISNHMKLWDKEIIQTYPFCTTRIGAKGVNEAISLFGSLKKQGAKVALILCNANAKRRQSEVDSRINFAHEVGLTEEDILFTSQLADKIPGLASQVPNSVVVQLFQISNLFAFPTRAEVCSNVLLEASMNKNLIVLNEDLKSLFDFAGEGTTLSYPFSSNSSIHYSGKNKENLEKLSKQIIGQLKSNKADLQFRHIWQNHSFDSIYREQLEPILYE